MKRREMHHRELEEGQTYEYSDNFATLFVTMAGDDEYVVTHMVKGEAEVLEFTMTGEEVDRYVIQSLV